MTIENMKRCVSGLALSLAVIHVLFPGLGIDFIAVTLIAIAVLPWLAPLVKYFELPGGLKFELHDLERAGERAEQAGLLSKIDDAELGPEYSFQIVADTDPNLALAGLRIEIEKRLVQLAELFDIGTKKQGVGRLMYELTKTEALTNEERSVLSDLVGLLNAAVHGEKWNDSAARWALETGPRLLKSLDERLRVATERLS